MTGSRRCSRGRSIYSAARRPRRCHSARRFLSRCRSTRAALALCWQRTAPPQLPRDPGEGFAAHKADLAWITGADSDSRHRPSRWSRIPGPSIGCASAPHAFDIDAKIVPVDSYDAGVQRLIDGTSDVLLRRGYSSCGCQALARTRDLTLLNRRFTNEPIALVLRAVTRTFGSPSTRS